MVRALEPIDGLEIMMRRRGSSRLSNLTNGPSKLCMAMGISEEQNGADLCMGPLCIETGVTIDQGHITQTTRVNVGKCRLC